MANLIQECHGHRDSIRGRETTASSGPAGWRKALWKQQTQILKPMCLRALRLGEWGSFGKRETRKKEGARVEGGSRFWEIILPPEEMERGEDRRKE